MGWMAGEFTIGRLAKAGGVRVQTIRYYERRCLLLPASRLPSGYRLYGEEALQRLRFIKNAQALGFTLDEVAELLQLRVDSRARCGDVQRKAANKLATVEAKIADLQRLARSLRGLISACRAGRTTDHCPILMSLEGDREMVGKTPLPGISPHGERRNSQRRKR